MPRKRTDKSLKRDCDKYWSLIIRSIGQCERCGKKGRLEAAHIFSRRYTTTRHDLENGLCLCTGCHFWAHHSPTDFTYWLEDRLGKDILEELSRRKNEIATKVDYEERLSYLKDIYDKSR